MANVARFESASEIINTAAVEVGLTANTAPFSSPDPAFKQLIKLLTICGRELTLMPKWNMAVREGTITVVAGQSEYDLPDDFLSVVESTVWNRGSNWPLYGSVTPQTWTLWARENPSLTFQAIFRLARRKFVIPVDAIFTPVRKVNFTVEPIHAGQETSHERLWLEVWTDGSIKPDDALAYAAKILKDQLTIVSLPTLTAMTMSW